MKASLVRTCSLLGSAALMLAACSSPSVQLGSRIDGSVPKGTERVITADGCGFQLLWFIPIMVNSRTERAYDDLRQKAAGDFITDVEVAESWTYGFVGTGYCTQLRAKAIHKAG